MSTGSVSGTGSQPFQLQISESPAYTTLTSPSGEQLEIPKSWMEPLEVVLDDLGHNNIRDAADNRDFSNLNEAQFGRLKEAVGIVGAGIENGTITPESLQNTMMSTIRTRAETLDEIVDANMSGMEAKNQALADVHAMIQEIRTAKPSGDKKGSEFEISKSTYEYMQSQGFDKGFTASGTDPVTLKSDKDQGVQSLLDNFKSKIDELSSNSQLEMIQLQGMINKRNQAYELLSTIMKSLTNSVDKAVNNLR